MVRFDPINLCLALTLSGQSEPHWADVNEALPWGKTEVRAIKRLVDRQWFERLWVLQEALANPNTLVLCGTSETTWETLFGSILGLVSKKSAMGWTQRRLSRIFSIVDAFYTARSPGLIRAVHRARTLKCADPRDKVYAVLGIASNSQQVKPDYTLSEYQVYRQLATAQIENGDLDFLSYCDLDSREVAGPTWVPDWSSEWTTQLMVWNNAAGFASAPITEHLDQGLIKVAAVRAGTLCKVDEVCLPSSDTSTIAAEVARLAPAHVESLPYKTGCSLLEAFSGTLATLDLNMSGGNVTFFPTLHASIDTVRSYLRCAEGTPLIDSIEDRTYRGYLWQGTTDRAFVSTDEGYIGLAPESAREGDVVYAILSCRSLIVLRPVEGFENRFQVVGVCFLYGLNHGEAILGSLPGHVRGEYHFDREADVWRDVYRNVDTDEISLEDPRLLALGIHPGLGANSLPNRVSGETLEKAGVGIDRIELV